MPAFSLRAIPHTGDPSGSQNIPYLFPFFKMYGTGINRDGSFPAIQLGGSSIPAGEVELNLPSIPFTRRRAIPFQRQPPQGPPRERRAALAYSSPPGMTLR